MSVFLALFPVSPCCHHHIPCNHILYTRSLTLLTTTRTEDSPREMEWFSSRLFDETRGVNSSFSLPSNTPCRWPFSPRQGSGVHGTSMSNTDNCPWACHCLVSNSIAVQIVDGAAAGRACTSHKTSGIRTCLCCHQQLVYAGYEYRATWWHVPGHVTTLLDLIPRSGNHAAAGLADVQCAAR